MGKKVKGIAHDRQKSFAGTNLIVDDSYLQELEKDELSRSEKPVAFNGGFQ